MLVMVRKHSDLGNTAALSAVAESDETHVRCCESSLSLAVAQLHIFLAFQHLDNVFGPLLKQAYACEHNPLSSLITLG